MAEEKANEETVDEDPGNSDFTALNSILAALAPFDVPDQERILKAVATFLHVSWTTLR